MTSVIAYFVSSALSLLGNSIAAIALPLLLLTTTGSVLGAGTLALATAVPSVLVGIVGGVIIDRINRRTASIAADLVSALAIAALPVIDLVTGLSLGWFIAVGLIGAIGDIPGMTAREALLPALVKSSGMSAERMLGIREVIGAATIIVGPAAAAGLIALLPGSVVLWITAATSLAAALVSLLISPEAGAIADKPTSRATIRTSVAELREGLHVLFFRSPLILRITALNLLLIAVFSTLQGLVLPAHFVAVDQPGVLGFVLSALALGTLVGGGLYAALGARVPRRAWFAGGLVGTVIGVAVVSVLGPTWLILSGAVILGIALGPLSSLLGVVMIERVPESFRGRIMGTQNSLLFAAAPVALFGTALLAEVGGLAIASAVLAAVWIIVAAVAVIAPGLRDLGAPEELNDPNEVLAGAK